MKSSHTFLAVVVTYNRLAMLKKCIDGLRNQSGLTGILIIDNASSDGTEVWLRELSTSDPVFFANIRLLANAGGAGGFAAGLRMAMERRADWVWMMDDDAEPHPNALEELLKIANNPANVYGSLAVNGQDTSWITTLLGPPRKVVSLASDVPVSSPVQSLPFLGFMIHRDLVRKIGLPDVGYFIAADDIEYCMRAERAGASLIIAGKSRIEHPKSRPYEVRLPGYTLTALELPPWKRYYDTRNRLLIARKYYGLRLLTQTIPGSFVRLFAALVREPRKGAQFRAWCCGMFDGLLGIKGKRHGKWGIPQ